MHPVVCRKVALYRTVYTTVISTNIPAFVYFGKGVAAYFDPNKIIRQICRKVILVIEFFS
jgi:hypothetical protein